MSEQHKATLERLTAELERATEQALQLSSRVRSVLEEDVRQDLEQQRRYNAKREKNRKR